MILEEVYPDDLPFLEEQIKRRKVDEYLIQLRITTHPHMEEDAQREFVEELMDRHQTFSAVDRGAELDREGLASLKEQLKRESKSIKVK